MTKDNSADWMEYQGIDTLEVGEYLWRVPHRRLASVWMIFRANVRLRGHGRHDRVPSPDFDHWDGYRVHIQDGTQYRTVRDGDPKVTVEGIQLLPCPFCGAQPLWSTLDGFVGSRPHQDNIFRITHCIAEAWCKTPQDAADAWNTRS